MLCHNSASKIEAADNRVISRRRFDLRFRHGATPTIDDDDDRRRRPDDGNGDESVYLCIIKSAAAGFRPLPKGADTTARARARARRTSPIVCVNHLRNGEKDTPYFDD